MKYQKKTIKSNVNLEIFVDKVSQKKLWVFGWSLLVACLGFIATVMWQTFDQNAQALKYNALLHNNIMTQRKFNMIDTTTLLVTTASLAAVSYFDSCMFIIQKNGGKLPDLEKIVISVDLKPYDWSKDVKAIKAPIFMAIGDADGVRYEHALELYRAKGGGKQGEFHGLPKSRLAILPGTTHIGMFMQRADWLIPMITDFLDSDLNEAPPTF